jgi:pSer/pThr/pTyr-binding forkhead associated (FHA) protein
MIQGNTVTITDLNSSNGTFIGDKRLVDNEAVSLVNKTVVYLGTQTCLEIEPVIPQH